MKKIIPLSLLAASYLAAADVAVDVVKVESTVISEVAENAQTSADVAVALSKDVPSIDMSRRSAIANDVYIRGQKRDNIVVEVDGTKVYGACPNRMDPPTSHIVAHQIEKIEVIEGPYDVETFGALSGEVKVTTKKPTKDLKASINLGFGAWNYRKIGATVSGGNDFIRMIATVSDETSDQYEDGNGDTLAEQLDIYNAQTGGGNPYQTKYKDVPAYKKKSAMVKAFISTAENQELRLSVTANRSDNILYANSSMDARFDDSNIYSAEYNIDSLSDTITNMNLQYYHSDVEHPMDTMYRVNGAAKYMTNHLKTAMDGIKLKTTIDLMAHEITVGLDGSSRTWEGEKYMTTVATGMVMPAGTPFEKVTTDNKAIFAKMEKSYGDLNVEIGARYDSTDISSADATKKENSYTAFSGNIMTTYNLNKENKIFLGIGQASRVPDARELYMNEMGIASNENLDQTTNQEIDLGYESNNKYFKLKAKAFYSMLSDYIYIENKAFENLDATIYGTEVSGSVYLGDTLTLNMGAAYKVGEKDSVAPGQDVDLADIAPLNGNVELEYEYANNSIASVDMQASQQWDKYDENNGEQHIQAWTVFNAKIKHAVNKKFDLTVGLNNIFDIQYAVSNTYYDLKLIGAGPVMLLNEPGRYFYTNLDFKF
jgi:iron complex outermembrane receptor protein